MINGKQVPGLVVRKSWIHAYIITTTGPKQRPVYIPWTNPGDANGSNVELLSTETFHVYLLVKILIRNPEDKTTQQYRRMNETRPGVLQLELNTA